MLGLELVAARIESASEIERAVAAFAESSSGALVVPPDVTTAAHADLIVALAARYRLPAVYAFSYMVTAGGLMSYGTDRVAEMRQAVSYLDRILRGASPGELPLCKPRPSSRPRST
jgi:putative ABC transport system substrate-binding protein